MICKENDMKKRTLALILATLMLLSSCSSGTGAMRQLFDSKKNTLASRAKSIEKIMKIKLSELPGVGDAE